MDFFARVLSGNGRLKERAREADEVNQAFKANVETLKQLVGDESGEVYALLDMVYDSSFPEEQIFLKTPSRPRLKSKKELVLRLLIGLDSMGAPVMGQLLVFVRKHGTEAISETLLSLLELLSPLLESKEAPEFTTDDFVDAMDFEWHSPSRTASPLLNVIASATSSPRGSAASATESPHRITASPNYRRAFSDRLILLSHSHELATKSALDKSASTATHRPALTVSVSSQYPAGSSEIVRPELAAVETQPSQKSSTSYSLDTLPSDQHQQYGEKAHRRKSSASLRQLLGEDAESGEEGPQYPAGSSEIVRPELAAVETQPSQKSSTSYSLDSLPSDQHQQYGEKAHRRKSSASLRQLFGEDAESGEEGSVGASKRRSSSRRRTSSGDMKLSKAREPSPPLRPLSDQHTSQEIGEDDKVRPGDRAILAEDNQLHLSRKGSGRGSPPPHETALWRQDSAGFTVDFSDNDHYCRPSVSSATAHKVQTDSGDTPKLHVDELQAASPSEKENFHGLGCNETVINLEAEVTKDDLISETEKIISEQEHTLPSEGELSSQSYAQPEFSISLPSTSIDAVEVYKENAIRSSTTGMQKSSNSSLGTPIDAVEVDVDDAIEPGTLENQIFSTNNEKNLGTALSVNASDSASISALNEDANSPHVNRHEEEFSESIALVESNHVQMQTDLGFSDNVPSITSPRDVSDALPNHHGIVDQGQLNNPHDQVDELSTHDEVAILASIGEESIQPETSAAQQQAIGHHRSQSDQTSVQSLYKAKSMKQTSPHQGSQSDHAMSLDQSLIRLRFAERLGSLSSMDDSFCSEGSPNRAVHVVMETMPWMNANEKEVAAVEHAKRNSVEDASTSDCFSDESPCSPHSIREDLHADLKVEAEDELAAQSREECNSSNLQNSASYLTRSDITLPTYPDIKSLDKSVPLHEDGLVAVLDERPPVGQLGEEEEEEQSRSVVIRDDASRGLMNGQVAYKFETQSPCEEAEEEAALVGGIHRDAESLKESKCEHEFLSSPDGAATAPTSSTAQSRSYAEPIHMSDSVHSHDYRVEAPGSHPYKNRKPSLPLDVYSIESDDENKGASMMGKTDEILRNEDESSAKRTHMKNSEIELAASHELVASPLLAEQLQATPIVAESLQVLGLDSERNYTDHYKGDTESDEQENELFAAPLPTKELQTTPKADEDCQVVAHDPDLEPWCTSQDEQKNTQDRCDRDIDGQDTMGMGVDILMSSMHHVDNHTMLPFDVDSGHLTAAASVTEISSYAENELSSTADQCAAVGDDHVKWDGQDVQHQNCDALSQGNAQDDHRPDASGKNILPDNVELRANHHSDALITESSPAPLEMPLEELWSKENQVLQEGLDSMNQSHLLHETNIDLHVVDCLSSLGTPPSAPSQNHSSEEGTQTVPWEMSEGDDDSNAQSEVLKLQVDTVSRQLFKADKPHSNDQGLGEHLNSSHDQFQRLLSELDVAERVEPGSQISLNAQNDTEKDERGSRDDAMDAKLVEGMVRWPENERPPPEYSEKGPLEGPADSLGNEGFKDSVVRENSTHEQGEKEDEVRVYKSLMREEGGSNPVWVETEAVDAGNFGPLHPPLDQPLINAKDEPYDSNRAWRTPLSMPNSSSKVDVDRMANPALHGQPTLSPCEADRQSTSQLFEQPTSDIRSSLVDRWVAVDLNGTRSKKKSGRRLFGKLRCCLCYSSKPYAAQP